VTPERTRLGYLSVSDTPTVVDVTGEHDPVAAALAVLEPVDDIHATADYRAHLVRVLSERVLASAQEMARRGEQSA
jgi:carbon-monoxide dehydrogenase medium subunit